MTQVLANRIAEMIAADAETCFYVRKYDSPQCSDPQRIRKEYVEYIAAQIQAELESFQPVNADLLAALESVRDNDCNEAGQGVCGHTWDLMLAAIAKAKPAGGAE